VDLAAAPPVASHAALRHRAFRLYLASVSLANLGSQMLGVAVGWQVYAVTHRPLDLGYVGLVQFAPALGLSLPAGAAADRFDRGRIVAFCNLVLAACAGALALLSWRGLAGPSGIAPVYAVLFVAGAARAFEGPAGQALVPGLVPAEHFPNAVTWSSGAWQIATIAGPAIGGGVYGAAGGTARAAAGVYAACVLALGAAGLLLLALPRRAPASGAEAATLRSVLEGLRYLRKRRILLGLVSLDLFAVLLGGATALLPVFASDVLHVGPRGLGLLRSAPAAGACATALWLAARPLKRRAGLILLACVAFFGVATIVFGVSRDFRLSLAALTALGASDMVSVVVRSTLVQLRTPHEMRGRVSAVNAMFIAGSSELGELESGLAAAWWGAVPAVILGGVGTIVVVVLYALLIPELRAVDRLEEAH
jgi:MFS family permease